MKLITHVLLASFMLCHHSAFGADKTNIEFLRQKHAGTARLSSPESVSDLFPKLMKATAECWAGVTEPSQLGLGGAVGTLTGASRIVQGELSSDGKSAFISVRAKGGLGLLQSNFLQIDLHQRSDATQVDLYHKNNVKAQRAFITEAEHWLAGDLAWCSPKPFMRKKSG